MDYLFFENQYIHNNISFFPMHKQVSSLWKIFQFYIENALLQVLGYYLTDFTALDKFLSSPSLGPRLFNLLVLYRGYANLRSAHHNTRKYVGIPNWLPRASISCKSVSRMLVFFLTELLLGNELSLATNLLIVPLKWFLTVLPAVSVPGLMLCVAKAFDEVTQTCEKYIICIRCKVLIKLQRTLITAQSRIYWNISKSIIAKFNLRKTIRKCVSFAKFISWNWNRFFP